jgi:hypothetical protein
MQARVLSVLESVGAAMPVVGYLVGALVASGHNPRATFLVAGIGVIAVVAVAGPLIGRQWSSGPTPDVTEGLGPPDEVMVELRPRHGGGMAEPKRG